MGREGLPEKLFVFFSSIRSAALPDRYKAREGWRFLFLFLDISGNSVAHKGSRGPALPLGQHPKIRFQRFIDEDRRTLHGVYVSIYHISEKGQC